MEDNNLAEDLAKALEESERLDAETAAFQQQIEEMKAKAKELKQTQKAIETKKAKLEKLKREMEKLESELVDLTSGEVPSSSSGEQIQETNGDDEDEEESEGSKNLGESTAKSAGFKGRKESREILKVNLGEVMQVMKEVGKMPKNERTDWMDTVKRHAGLVNIWQHINGDLKMPAKEDWENYNIWSFNDKVAVSSVLQLLDEETRTNLRSSETSYEVWMRLMEICDYFSRRSIATIINKLANLEIKQNQSIKSYLAEARSLRDELVRIHRVQYDDKALCEQVLLGVSKKYEEAVRSIEREGFTHNFEKICDILYIEERIEERIGKKRQTTNNSKQEPNNNTGTKTMIKPAYSSTIPCKDFAHGNCKWGEKCKFMHGNKEEASQRKDENKIKTTNSSPATTKGVVGSIERETNEDVESATTECLFDSGSPVHIVKDGSRLMHLQHASLPLCNPDGSLLQVTGVGQLVINDSLTLRKVYVCPDLKADIISTIELDNDGYAFYQCDGVGSIIRKRDGKIVLKGELNKRGKIILQKSHIFVIEREDQQTINEITEEGETRILDVEEDEINDNKREQKEEKDTFLWHKRLGHPGIARFVGLQKLKAISSSARHCKECDVCAKSKLAASPVGKGPRKTAEMPYELVHADLLSLPVPTRKGEKYALIVKDDCTRYVWVWLLHTKGQVAQKLVNFALGVEEQERKRGFKIKRLRSDRGGEFGESLGSMLEEIGILHEQTPPYKPRLNGVVERTNRSLLEMTRALLQEAEASDIFWGDALEAAVHINNRIPSTVDGRIPFATLTGGESSVSHLRTWGCVVWAKNNREGTNKLSPTGVKCALIGFEDIYNSCYRLITLDTGREVESDSVIFHEGKKGLPELEALGEISNEEWDSEEEDEQQGRRKTNKGREIKRPKWQRNFVVGVIFEGMEVKEPRGEKEALRSPHAKYWIAAMEEEMESIKDNNVWELVKKPANKKILSCRWVFRFKPGTSSSSPRLKARLVVRGNEQEDDLEVFCPVSKGTSVRIHLALATAKRMHIHCMDVKTAFLYGIIREETYMVQPPYFAKAGDKRVCHLKRALYGLKQAPRAWYARLHDYLLRQGFQRSSYDYALFFRGDGESRVFISVYVDDLIISSVELMKVDELKNELRKEFKMTDLGPLRNILGLEIERGKNFEYLHLHQRTYINNFTKGSEGRRVTTPAAELREKEDEVVLQEAEQTGYRSGVGKVMYAMTSTRPDIAFAVSRLTRHFQTPTKGAQEGLGRLLSYLRDTTSLGPKYEGSNWEPVGYVDASFAPQEDGRRSQTGWVVLMCGAPVSWSSKRQGHVTTSTAEAEYVALCEMTKEIVWMRGLLLELGFAVKEPTVINEDNQAAVALAKNPVHHQRSKHIDVAYHFTRERVERGEVEVRYCPTERMLADGLTKALPREKHVKLCEGMGLCALPAEISLVNCE